LVDLDATLASVDFKLLVLVITAPLVDQTSDLGTWFSNLTSAQSIWAKQNKSVHWASLAKGIHAKLFKALNKDGLLCQAVGLHIPNLVL
jgi:hypothetical protein